eukprot:TRINITY_DN2336_c0_g1_i1.p1 TRINITY_DN2336_c0_g1~~TRINITY_DN2336_c0_g1_i1.p1  ORF type:complete len:544 (+),score=78.36 TRINITY_DN2336_c0_g1_i1:48-1634(+)
MKAVLAAGGTPTCFECDKDLGGFWRYKDEVGEKSVYASTHIDTDRDLNSYGDFPFDPAQFPIILDHSKIVAYLRLNVAKFGLDRYLRFDHRVEWITPADRRDDGRWTWRVTYSHGGEKTTEIFDAVMICTGRHSQPFTPKYPGQDIFGGLQLHSAHYKYPEKHGLTGKRVVVVGIGNSGCDIVTELATTCSQCYIVARHGAWVLRAKGDDLFRARVPDRIGGAVFSRVPWQILTKIVEKQPAFRSQPILNQRGLRPDHRFLQTHPTATGIGQPNNIFHTHIESGRIIAKRGIVNLTKKGIVLVDENGKSEEVECDAIVWCTGYKQAVSFLDPSVVDMRYERSGNEVPLYMYMFPMNLGNCHSFAFINFVQSATFLCSELQSRYFMRVLNGQSILPEPKQMEAEQRARAESLSKQYYESDRHRIQAGINTLDYYDELARRIGCYPGFFELLKKNPRLVWHGWFAPLSGMVYRLVGPNAQPDAPELIERAYKNMYEGANPRNRGILGFPRYLIELILASAVATVAPRARL